MSKLLKNDDKFKAIPASKRYQKDHPPALPIQLQNFNNSQESHFLPPIVYAPNSYQSNYNSEHVVNKGNHYSNPPPFQQEKTAVIQTLGESIKVAIRPRPLLAFELQRGDYSCVNLLSENVIEVSKLGEKRQFKFDFALPSQATQAEAFHELGLEALLDSVLEGYAATIIAYGQTGSGKTYTFPNKVAWKRR